MKLVLNKLLMMPFDEREIVTPGQIVKVIILFSLYFLLKSFLL